MNEKTAERITKKLMAWLQDNCWELEFDDEETAEAEIKQLILDESDS
jgi:hypothetical protein